MSQQSEEDDASVEEQATRTNQEKDENEEGEEEQHEQRSEALDCVFVCSLLRGHFVISKRLRCTRTQIVVLWLKVERALRNKTTCCATC